MEGPDRSPWFLGDLEDPWVLEIAEALPPGTTRWPCAGDLPDAWPEGLASARTVVLHRPHLTAGDGERVRRLRDREGGPPRVVVCVGPHVRYSDLVLWGPLVDVILPEATAAQTVARHLAGRDELWRPPRPAWRNLPRVAVVSGLYELRSTLADACTEGGYPVSASADWTEAPPGGLAVWDVPILQDDWPATLASQAKERALVALIGFADRVSVGLARAGGAAACLDLPCDPADLLFVLDRVARDRGLRGGEPAHEVPPRPESLRQPRAGRPVAETPRRA